MHTHDVPDSVLGMKIREFLKQVSMFTLVSMRNRGHGHLMTYSETALQDLIQVTLRTPAFCSTCQNDFPPWNRTRWQALPRGKAEAPPPAAMAETTVRTVTLLTHPPGLTPNEGTRQAVPTVTTILSDGTAHDENSL